MRSEDHLTLPAETVAGEQRGITLLLADNNSTQPGLSIFYLLALREKLHLDILLLGVGGQNRLVVIQLLCYFSK